MAQFFGAEQARIRREDKATEDGFAAFGKDVPLYRQAAALAHCREIGLDTNKGTSVVSRMSEAIARDKPYEAMEAAMAHLDLTGTYRVLAVLCTAEKPRRSVAAAMA
jgi:hypothetical protein